MPVTRAYCSKLCSLQSRSKAPVEKKCTECGHLFTGRHGVTCSPACTLAKRQATVAASTKICAWCAKEFSGNTTKKYCNGEHFASCEVCKKSFAVDPYKSRRTCSNLCNGKLVNSAESMVKRRANSEAKWGTAFPLQSSAVKAKIAESNMERYGVASPLASKELRAKGRETTRDRYGADWYAQSEEGKAARAATNLERYGAENPFAAESVKDAIRAKHLEQRGVAHPMQDPTVVESVKNTNMLRYGVPNVLMVPAVQEKVAEALRRRREAGLGTSRTSKLNLALQEQLLRELGCAVTLEEPLGDFSADLGLRRSGDAPLLLVDLHPTISHNALRSFGCVIQGCEDPCPVHAPPAKDYHFKRAQAALAADRTLIQWYGWESHEKLSAFLKPRMSKLRSVSARKLQLKPISGREANSFLKLHHVQGDGRGQTHCYGLFDEKELLAVATFGPARFGASAEAEFIRYAVADTHVIHGGAGRLLDAFKRDAKPRSIISYVDFNHTTRSRTFLHSAGFEELSPTGPALIWHRLRDNRVVKHTSLLAIGADRILKTAYGTREESGMDNTAIMLAEGFLPVYTAGNRVFRWTS
jgi:hypothetical protein